jgi:hypothetical protein
MCPRHQSSGTLTEATISGLEPNHYRSLYTDDLPGHLRVEEHTAQLEREKSREFQRDFREGRIHVLSCSTTFELGVDLGDLDAIFLRNVPPESFNYAQRVGRSGRRSGFAGFVVTYCRRNPHDLYHFLEPAELLAGLVKPPVLGLGNEKIITRHIAAVALSKFFRSSTGRFANVQDLAGDLLQPRGLSDFRTFILDYRLDLEASLREIIPRALSTRMLAGGYWIDCIAGNESRFECAEAELSSDYTTVMNLENSSAQAGDYDTAKWAKARRKTIADENVLTFLSRKAVIPKYGFPVDVVELDTQKTQSQSYSMDVALQRDLSIAVAEFAPSSKLIANKKAWVSYGIKRVAEKEWPRRRYKRCTKHNLFTSWNVGEQPDASHCCDRLVEGTMVVPQFGFVTDGQRPTEPASRPPRSFTTRPFFARTIGQTPEVIGFNFATITKSSPGLMVVLCEGQRGQGFYVCGQCGAGFRKRERQHRSPYRQDCRGTLEKVSLGHEFVTDVVQLQFTRHPEGETEPVWFAYSLAYALVEGAANVLEIPSTDLSATVAYVAESRSVPSIILYDNVPGGAGLVARLENQRLLRDCMEAAHHRVSGVCGCDEAASCYGCLRSYRNQFVHEKLCRGPVKDYIGHILAEWE